MKRWLETPLKMRAHCMEQEMMHNIEQMLSLSRKTFLVYIHEYGIDIRIHVGPPIQAMSL